MELPPRLLAALRSLDGAVDLLEAAAERRTEADAGRADLEAELHLMGEDRLRLAAELELSEERCDTLAEASRTVSRTLDTLIGTLQSDGGTDRPAAV